MWQCPGWCQRAEWAAGGFPQPSLPRVTQRRKRPHAQKLLCFLTSAAKMPSFLARIWPRESLSVPHVRLQNNAGSYTALLPCPSFAAASHRSSAFTRPRPCRQPRRFLLKESQSKSEEMDSEASMEYHSPPVLITPHLWGFFPRNHYFFLWGAVKAEEQHSGCPKGCTARS